MFNYILNFVDKLSAKGIASTGGRNFKGRVCVFHKGGSTKRLNRVVDLYRRVNHKGLLYKILKDSNRTAYLGVIIYENGLLSYIILADKTFISNNIFSGVSKNNILTNSSSNSLANLPLLTVINNVETYPFSGAKLARSAGTRALLTRKVNNMVFLKLTSGWQISVAKDSLASIGLVSNPLHYAKRIYKAGINRGLGIRPTVRGVAKNPCDHPHGGGEGKKPKPRAPRSPWGFLTKGTPTKNKKIDRLKRKLYKKIS